MNYYLLLGVPRDADPEAIRSAFRALARRYHPDAGEGSSADRFREILIAYETLNDSSRRQEYDRHLQQRRAPVAQFVEPLRAQAAPEPMLRPRSGIVHQNPGYEPPGPTRLDELIDELFQSWDELFFGIPRRRDRV
jgi:curved DNA-binding protein CbpA